MEQIDFSGGFRRGMVALITGQGYPVAEVSLQFGIGNLRRWYRAL
ncbi:transposase [Komagataeibacter xylinus]|uniref:Transposase n=1 Tax=Komagataeibacter xylinus TaxID=28448 RepID=A0A857FMT8_KOMXY|nr:transposase [Komagataeibacter xylinus]QHC35613.1 transposase [Komagataeibacter xylinus]